MNRNVLASALAALALFWNAAFAGPDNPAQQLKGRPC